MNSNPAQSYPEGESGTPARYDRPTQKTEPHSRRRNDKEEFDFRKDPPPDLAVEVEITSSLVNRVGIYAAIGVPEIWRYDGKRLRFCVLQSDGEYLDSETSRAFSFLRPAALMPFLSRDSLLDETTRIRQFVEWFRQQGFSA